MKAALSALSALVAGFVAVLVGFTSWMVIVFQAAAAFGATEAEATSWNDEQQREAALVTASGLSLSGVGAPFRRVAAGTLTLAVQRFRRAG